MAWYLGAGWRRFYTQSNPKPVWEPQKNTHPKMKNKLTMFRSVSLVSRSSAESLCSVNSSPGRSLPPTLSHRWLGVRMRSGVVPPGHPWWASRPRVGRGEAEHGCPSFSAVRFSPLFKFYRSAADLPRVHFCCATKWLSYTHASFSLFLSFRCDLGMLSAAPWARREALVILVYDGSHLLNPGAQSSPPHLAISALGSFDLLLLSPRTSPALRGSPANLNPLHQGGHLTCQGRTRGSQQTLTQGGTRMSAPRALVRRDSAIPLSPRRKQTKSEPSSAVSPGGGAPLWTWEAASFSGHLWYKIFDSSRQVLGRLQWLSHWGKWETPNMFVFMFLRLFLFL